MTPVCFESALAAAMMETAKLERRRAAARDGTFPGGMPQAKRCGPKNNGRKFTPAGTAALALIEADPRLCAAEVAKRTGLSASRVRALIRKRIGIRPRGCRPGEGGAPRTPASIEAEKLLLEGMTARQASEATGLSRAQVHRIAKTIREARAAA